MEKPIRLEFKVHNWDSSQVSYQCYLYEEWPDQINIYWGYQSGFNGMLGLWNLKQWIMFSNYPTKKAARDVAIKELSACNVDCYEIRKLNEKED